MLPDESGQPTVKTSKNKVKFVLSFYASRARFVYNKPAKSPRDAISAVGK